MDGTSCHNSRITARGVLAFAGSQLNCFLVPGIDVWSRVALKDATCMPSVQFAQQRTSSMMHCVCCTNAASAWRFPKTWTSGTEYNFRLAHYEDVSHQCPIACRSDGPGWVVSALLRYELTNKKMRHRIPDPFQVIYTVCVTHMCS